MKAHDDIKYAAFYRMPPLRAFWSSISTPPKPKEGLDGAPDLDA
jgi:hypothetical protein